MSKEVSKIGKNLKCGEHGIWFSKSRAPVSYPKDRHAQCLAVEDNSFWFKHRNRCLIEVLALYPPNGTIFDIGGGNGYVSLALEQAGWDTVLVEPGYKGALHAHARGLQSIICATFKAAGFNANSIPAVGIFDVLEHIEKDTDFVKTIKHALVPNGRLYMTLPAYQFLWSVEDDHCGHYRRYTLSGITAKLASLGFNVEFKTYIFGLLPAPIFLLRSIPTRLGFRTKSQFGRIQREHGRGGNFLAQLCGKAFDWEIKALRNKTPIPFGSSCLIVARSAHTKP